MPTEHWPTPEPVVRLPGHYARFQRGAMPDDLSSWVDRWNETGMDIQDYATFRLMRVTRATPVLWFRMESLHADGTVRRGRLLVVGAFTRSAWVPITTAPENILFFLRPGSARAVLGIPAEELSNRRVFADEVFGADGNDLEHRLAVAHTHSKRRTLLAAFVRARLTRFARPVDLELVSCIQHLRHPCRVRDVAEPYGWSIRQVERLCAAGVGMGLKRVSILLRAGDAMQHALQLAEPQWQSIAMDFGFYDQSHLIHAVTEVFGHPPARFHTMVRRGGRCVDGMITFNGAPTCSASL